MVTREKKTKSGKLLEIDIYPTFKSGKAIPDGKNKESSEAQKKYNRNRAVKKLVRLVNANFGEGDHWVHLTYSAENAPQNEKEARRDIRNFLRRVKTRRKTELKKAEKELEQISALRNAGMYNEYIENQYIKAKAKKKKLKEELKYLYAIEAVEYKCAKLKGRKNWHFHLFMTGGLDEGAIYALWTKGECKRVSKYRPDKFGPETAARYMIKDPKGSRSFSGSKNLKKPVVRTRETTLTPSAVERIARTRVDDSKYWERKNKGYKLLRTYVRWNDYNKHWYITAVMYKTEDEAPPWEWEADEWES